MDVVVLALAKKIASGVIGEETNLRILGDQHLQDQIDAMSLSTDVIDVIADHETLLTYNVTEKHVHDEDIIKVLSDSTKLNAICYWRYKTNQPSEGTFVPANPIGYWLLLGEQGPYYTKTETDAAIRSAVGDAIGGAY